MLNIKKTKYTLFHKYSIGDKIPLKLPTLKIGNKVIEKTIPIKFLEMTLDENVLEKIHKNSWKLIIKKHWFAVSCKTISWWNIFKNNIYFI